jgi:flagellar motor component MotA
MFIIARLVIVLGSTFSDTLRIGQNAMLMQWSEFIIIGGLAAGEFFNANPMHVVKH